MLHLVIRLFVLISIAGCNSAPLEIVDMDRRTWSNPDAGECPGPVASDGELGCRLDTPHGCVCGVDDGTGRNLPNGACYDGACCKGCWDDAQHVCLPGNDARGWGERGEPCHARTK